MEINPQLYRKRFIPEETVHLKDDTILLCTQSLIVTKWNTLKPRSDISHGISAYFIDKGIKVSKVFNHLNEFVYWYCDIIHTITDNVNHYIVFEDLLIDIIINCDNHIKIVDIAEVADACEKELITKDQMFEALRITDSLLSMIYNGSFKQLTDVVDKYDINLQ